MTTPQQEPDVVLTVERGKPMHFECVRAVWGYGQYDLYVAPPADDGAVRLLERHLEHSYNPFEPDNQSRLYNETAAYLAKVSR